MEARANGSKPKGKVTVRREVSAGGLIWRLHDGAVEVVLVRPAGKQTWVLPKGHLEPGEGIIEAPVREATEDGAAATPAAEPAGTPGRGSLVHPLERRSARPRPGRRIRGR